MHRQPYFIDQCIWSRDLCEVAICADGPSLRDQASGMFSNGLSVNFVSFFIEHGQCAHCGTPIAKNFDRCKCGELSREGVYLEIKFPTELYSTHFKKYLESERSRIRSARRAAMMKNAGGNFDREHIKGMHQAQRGMCYFCAMRIELGSKSLHADHYLPLALGGRNDLANIVLTCSKCNLKKNAMSGHRFDALARRNRAPELTDILREIRKDLKAYKKSAEMNKQIFSND